MSLSSRISVVRLQRAALLCLLIAVVCGSGLRAADPILFKGHKGLVYDAVFLPDGRQVVTASFDYTLKLWDVATQEVIRTMEGHTSTVLCVAVSPDGTTIASGASDNTIKLWDVPKSDPVATLPAHDGEGTAIAVSTDGKLVATGDNGGVVRIWNSETGEKSHEFKLAGPIARLDWRHDNHHLAVADRNGFLHLINPRTG